MDKRKSTESETMKTIKASFDRYKDFKLDPVGYFLIRYVAESQELEAGFCRSKNIIEKKIVGKTAEEVFNTIIREGLVTIKQHAADLGKELEKAEIAMKLGIDYVQDSPLDLSGVKHDQT